MDLHSTKRPKPLDDKTAVVGDSERRARPWGAAVSEASGGSIRRDIGENGKTGDAGAVLSSERRGSSTTQEIPCHHHRGSPGSKR